MNNDICFIKRKIGGTKRKIGALYDQLALYEVMLENAKKSLKNKGR